MSWNEIVIGSWSDLARRIEGRGIGRETDPGWQFRGQADASWDLKPSILRLFERGRISRNKAHGIECGVFRRFVAQARIHFGAHVPADNGGPDPVWWMLMQHHSCPTRLLDWTDSPYVAAYFAVEQSLDKDGAVWVFPSSPLDTYTEKQFGHRTDVLQGDGFFSATPIPAVYPILGIEHNARSLAQQGVYTVSSDIMADHGALIQAALNQTKWAQHLAKLIIPSRLKHEILCQLRAMNITAAVLFPGPDGVGRSAAEYVRTRVWDNSNAEPTT